MAAASPWLLLQYAECFAGGFLTAYLLCPRSKKRELKGKDAAYLDNPEMNIQSDGETTVSVVITEEPEAKGCSDLKDGWSCTDRKQEEQTPKYYPQEGKNNEEKYEEEEGKKDEFESYGTIQCKTMNIQPKNEDDVGLVKH